MPITKKQQVRGTRILLTVFYGFLLSSIIYRYIIHGIVEIIRKPTNPYAITMLILGTIILISIGLAIYATWYDNLIILLVSGIVLICVFILTIVFGITRIIKMMSVRSHLSSNIKNIMTNGANSPDLIDSNLPDEMHKNLDNFAIGEHVAQLIIELISILFAILANFILHRYVKSKYSAVPTSEKNAAT